MATYKGIQGYSVQSLASDPTASKAVGQLWYNSASNVWKIAVEATGAFSAGGALNNSRGYFGGAGTQSAAQVAGGSPAPMNQKNETYDGTTWTETTALNSGHSAGTMAGSTNTASLCFSGGGSPTKILTESWNGSTWTELGDLNTPRDNGPAGFGTQAAAICCGGDNPPLTEAESWNGSSWSITGAMNGGRRNFAGTGIQTAGIVSGGMGPGGVSSGAETYNGSTWTAVNNLLVAARGITMFGEKDTAYSCGGGTTTLNEYYNGTSWTEVADLATGRNDSAAGGSSSAGFVAGGPQVGGTATEEWNDPAYSIKTVTTS
jgi:hypothetical protein